MRLHVILRNPGALVHTGYDLVPTRELIQAPASIFPPSGLKNNKQLNVYVCTHVCV